MIRLEVKSGVQKLIDEDRRNTFKLLNSISKDRGYNQNQEQQVKEIARSVEGN